MITAASLALSGSAFASQVTANAVYSSGDDSDLLKGYFSGVSGASSLSSIASLTFDLNSSTNQGGEDFFVINLYSNTSDTGTALQTIKTGELTPTYVGGGGPNSDNTWAYTISLTSGINSSILTQLQNNGTLGFTIAQDCYLDFTSGQLVVNKTSSVPDGGSTIALLGMALVGISAAGRKLGLTK
jgi:hypothetical protein